MSSVRHVYSVRVRRWLRGGNDGTSLFLIARPAPEGSLGVRGQRRGSR
jgi:hypothetical protein